MSLLLTVIAPLLASGLIWLIPRKQETLIGRVALGSTAFSFGLFLYSLYLWMPQNFQAADILIVNLSLSNAYFLPVKFLFDGISASFMGLTTSVMFFLVCFSRYYLHRDQGYRRFFFLMMMFQAGLHTLFLAGNLKMTLIGWEIIGTTSFFLINFYSERSSASRNATKTYAIYHICGIGLLLAPWFAEHHAAPLVMCGLLLFAAMGKSAQVPFTFWIPRAMEGPTPSSAVFYGALSIHCGVFLMLRTLPLWGTSLEGRVLVGAVGLLTAFVATGVGRVQPNIKGQLAYASATQVGLMFFELSLGFTGLVLFHAITHSYLRFYQLLISSAIVTYRLRHRREAHLYEKSRSFRLEKFLPKPLQLSLYTFAFHEGFLESALRGLIVKPLEWISCPLKVFLKAPWLGNLIFMGGGVLAVLLSFLTATDVPLLLGLGVFFTVAAFRCRDNVETLWHLAGLSLLVFGFVLYQRIPQDKNLAFFILILPVVLLWLYGKHLLKVSGFRVFSAPMIICFLGLVGFPLSPTFVGVEMLTDDVLNHRLFEGIVLAASLALNAASLSMVFRKV